MTAVRVEHVVTIDRPIRLTLRLDPDLHAELKWLAEAGDRSLHREIVRALRGWTCTRSGGEGDR
jgi:hypothetical protein